MEGQVGCQKQGWHFHHHIGTGTDLPFLIQQTSAYLFFPNILVFVDKPHMYVVIPVDKMIIYIQFLQLKPFVYICATK